MANCPACAHEVQTPSVLSLEGWSHLACTECKARLEMKPRPAGFLLLPILICLLWVSRLGHPYAVTAEILMAVATVALVMLLVIHPAIRLRQNQIPKPGIRLNIDGPSS